VALADRPITLTAAAAARTTQVGALLQLPAWRHLFAHGGTRKVSQDINVLALVKGEERYVFLFDDAHKAEVLRVLGRFASNPELSFTWYDAAVLSQKVRQEPAKTKHSGTHRFKDVPLITDSGEETL
jgi:hypothetical protein